MDKQKDLMELMKKELATAKTLTENGAIAYESSGKALVDFHFGISAFRDEALDVVLKRFMRAFYEDPMVAMKYLFYVGDVRQGLGERKIFRSLFSALDAMYPQMTKELLSLIPEYHRWDFVVEMALHSFNKENQNKATAIIIHQLNDDIPNANQGNPISLLAKWMPSENASSKETKRDALELARRMMLTPRIYRKILSKLRKHLDVTEVKMSAKKWDEIDYNKVPSQANLRYRDAFLRNDEERRREYLKSLAQGNAKINTSTLYPHQIVEQYGIHYYNTVPVNETLEELWANLPVFSLDNTLVVRDGSGSMTWGYTGNCSPLNVATALAVYMAEHNTGIWKNKFITFSAQPKIIDLTGFQTLRDKLIMMTQEDDCSNTNLFDTMMLILNTAVKHHLTQDEMPKRIVICSDMQFDGRAHHFNETLFETIQQRFKNHGYLLPKIIFWNLSSRFNETVPIQENEMGLALISGFSLNLLKMVMNNSLDPYQALLEELNTERYAPVENAIKDVIATIKQSL